MVGRSALDAVIEVRVLGAEQMITPIKLNHCEVCDRIILLRNHDDEDFNDYLKQLGYRKLSGVFIHSDCLQKKYPYLFPTREEVYDEEERTHT